MEARHQSRARHRCAGAQSQDSRWHKRWSECRRYCWMARRRQGRVRSQTPSWYDSWHNARFIRRYKCRSAGARLVCWAVRRNLGRVGTRCDRWLGCWSLCWCVGWLRSRLARWRYCGRRRRCVGCRGWKCRRRLGWTDRRWWCWSCSVKFEWGIKLPTAIRRVGTVRDSKANIKLQTLSNHIIHRRRTMQNMAAPHQWMASRSEWPRAASSECLWARTWAPDWEESLSARQLARAWAQPSVHALVSVWWVCATELPWVPVSGRLWVALWWAHEWACLSARALVRVMAYRTDRVSALLLGCGSVAE